MTSTVETISFGNLIIGFVPVVAVVGILLTWSLDAKYATYAIVRMLGQLLLIGYLLTTIFETESSGLIVAILVVMVFSSSWIALGTIKDNRRKLFKYALMSISLGGFTSLAFVTQGVLGLSPWYFPQYVVPLAGMIFASSMNSVSLAAERLHAEMTRGMLYDQAKTIALKAALIPVINAMLAVGLVSIPGMMTGQILSDVSPLVAVRYQIMVMCMVFGASGISAACFLVLVKSSSNEWSKT
ncbi:MAG: hypothetical protein COA99_07970 [Moraxellaceae bacterium]|nr:MAG: hypothetical protein COA99_07970 [Moraxellaceae bacterium]